MAPTVLAQLLLIAAVAWIIFDSRKRNSVWRQLDHELRARLPVFSAETVAGKEAEFIRDRLPGRLTAAVIVLAAVGVVGTLAAWWLLD
jgi:hypothetical protein